jgi:DNA-binding NarL/FixJ family response regulator
VQTNIRGQPTVGGFAMSDCPSKTISIRIAIDIPVDIAAETLAKIQPILAQLSGQPPILIEAAQERPDDLLLSYISYQNSQDPAARDQYERMALQMAEDGQSNQQIARFLSITLTKVVKLLKRLRSSKEGCVNA